MENPTFNVDDGANDSNITSSDEHINHSKIDAHLENSTTTEARDRNGTNRTKENVTNDNADHPNDTKDVTLADNDLTHSKGDALNATIMTPCARNPTTGGDTDMRQKRFVNDHPMESDEVLQILGRNGKYQLLVFFLISFVTLRGVWHLFGGIFLAADPGHLCKLAANQTANGSIPIVTNDGVDSYDTCHMFLPGSQNLTQPCTDGWSYGDSFQSVVVEWDFVCDRSYLSDLSTSVFMAGMIVGSLILSPLADRFGRKTLLLAALWVQGVIGVATAFVNDVAVFMVMRFCLGALNQTIGLVAYVLVPEAFPSSNRTVPYFALFLFWSGGIMSFALFGYLIRDWRWLEVAISVPNFLTIPYFWILPESIPWLMAKQKLKQAEIVIRKAAKLNGIALPAEMLNLSTGQSSTELLPDDKKIMTSSEKNGACKDIVSNDFENILSNSAREMKDNGVFYDKNDQSPSKTDNTDAVFSNGHKASPPKSQSDSQNDSKIDSLADLPVINTNGVQLTSYRKHLNGLQETNDISESVAVTPTSYNVIDLFRTPKMRIYSLIIFFLWLVNSLSYFGISFSVPILHGDIFINLFISGVVEVPAYLLCMGTVEWLGRRRPLSVFMLVCGISSVIAIFVPSETDSGVDLTPLKTTLAMVSKFGITGAYVTVYLFCVEIFPTVVRNLGLGIAAAFETVGAVAAPFIASSAKTIPQLPLTLFGVLTVIGGVLCLVLPETHRKRLPETIEEVEGWNKKTGEKAKGR